MVAAGEMLEHAEVFGNLLRLAQGGRSKRR
jgi:hypothetical protein